MNFRPISLILSLGVAAWAAADSPVPAPAPDAIVQNFCAATQAQADTSKSASMDVDIKASLPKLKKEGRLRGLRKISTIGRITYDKLFFEGDNTVKHEVIARYLNAEAEAQQDPKESLAVTPANYKFKFQGRTELDGRSAYLFQVTPKRKRVELFKGEIWIDAASYLPLQESGYLAKRPSIFVKRIAFFRRFEIRDGISVPLQVQTVADLILFGKAEVTVDFSNFSLDDASVQESNR